MKIFFKLLFIFSIIICFWQGLILFFKLPEFILPSPQKVFEVFWINKFIIINNFSFTFYETLSGLFLGIMLGGIIACFLAYFEWVHPLFFPLLLITQALPTFAIAPLLVIWFGFGVAAKIITTILMVFFPVVSAFYDGLKATPARWLDFANSINATKWRIFLNIKIPAALPHLFSGIRVATAAAPIGAVIGEWVGASHGLGYLMLNANARMEISLMFAALFTLCAFSLILYSFMNIILNKILFWNH